MMLDEKRVEELKEKIEKSKEIFKQAYERFKPEELRLIWSGGKDSTLTAWTCRQFCQENGLIMPKAFTIDEGDSFEEIDTFLKKYSKEWNIVLDWGKNDEYVEDVPEAEMVPAHIRYKPILHFTERDIWDTTLHFHIPFCPLYKVGYRSLGAKTTSIKMADIPAWEQDLEHTEERAGRRQDKERTMDRLRKLGYM